MIYLLLVFTVLIPVGLLLSGLVFKTLWWWFVVPVFHLPGLSVAQAIGVAMVVQFLTHQTLPTDKDSTMAKLFWGGFGKIGVHALAYLAIGAIVKACLP